MAIHMMTSAEHAGEPGVTGPIDYPGSDRPIYLAESFAGCVLATGEYNMYDDSDFYAVVWDEGQQKVRRVVYATTRGWSYPNGAKVDATDEVKEKAAAYLAKLAMPAYVRECRIVAQEVLNAPPEQGERVKVVKGRKVPKGTEGVVIWVGQDFYRAGAFRIGIRDDAGEKYFTAASNVVSAEPARRREVAGSEVRKRCYLAASREGRKVHEQRLAKGIRSSENWRGATYVPRPGWVYA